jgi:hypothetical protein
MLSPSPALPRILVAVTPEGFPVVARILGGVAQVRPVFSEAKAVELLEGGIDLVLCSLRFDESRMLDLVRDAMRSVSHVPCICCRVMKSELAHDLMRGAFVAAGTLGAVGFIDLPELEQQLGREAAEERFRQMVLAQLPERATSAPARPAPPHWGGHTSRS